MESRKLHIIVAEEEGKIRRVAISVSRLKKIFFFSSVFLMFLTFMSGLSFKLIVSNRNYSNLIAKLSSELEALKKENSQLKEKVFALEKEKERILEGAVAELKEKSSIIEKILSEIGLKNKDKNRTSGKGGPFLPAPFDKNYKSLLERTEYLIENIKQIPLGYPVYGRITSGFGMRIDPFNGKWAFHSGVDIKGRIGLPIRVTADGIVKSVGYSRGYGKYVIIYHGRGFSTLYAHLYKIKVKRWQRVKRGDVIGLMGNTGRSTGPHLHYEVRVGNRPVNPLKFMKLNKILSRG